MLLSLLANGQYLGKKEDELSNHGALPFASFLLSLIHRV